MQVFRATLDGVQTVAVKQLLEQNQYQQQKFVNEIAILRSCRNENIVCFLGEWATWCMGTITAIRFCKTSSWASSTQKLNAWQKLQITMQCVWLRCIC